MHKYHVGLGGYVCVCVGIPMMGSDHHFRSFQPMELRSQLIYKSLDHDPRHIISTMKEQYPSLIIL